MRADGGRPSNRALVTRNGSDVGGNRGDTHYTHTVTCVRVYDMRTHTCVQMHNSLLFLSASFSTIIPFSPSRGPDHPPRSGLSNHISLYVILLSGAVSLLFSHSSPLLLSSLFSSPFLSFTPTSTSPYLSRYSSLGYNVAASGVRGIIAGCVRSPRLCTAGAGTYYADVCNPLCASRIRPPPSLLLLYLSLSFSRFAARAHA